MEFLLASPQEFGPYTLIERVSVGGMAEVFRAFQRDTGRTVAIKRILPGVAEDDEFLELFFDESRIARHLEHDNIARIFDIGEVGNSHYIALEFIEGMPLRTVIDRANARRAGIPVELAVYFIEEVARGLAYAHDRTDAQGRPLGIVHRDVSPQNVLIAYNGAVKLIDFGIAKAENRLSQTQAGSIKGKVGYMAPEQIVGGTVDRRTDIFALGISLWETLAMRRLFDAPNELLVMEQIRSRAIPPPSTVNPLVPPELDRIVLKALAKDPKERYPTASEFEADLRTFARSQPTIGDAARAADFMSRIFPTEASQARASASDHQESNRMSDKGGSDLDVFDGLAKKSQPRPGAPSQRAPAPPAAKKTLLGLAAPNLPLPPPSRPVPSRPPAGPPSRGPVPPPAPPSRGSLPPPPMTTRGVAPPPAGPMSRPGAPPPPVSRPPVTAPLPKPPPANAAPVDMDWDDEDEKTAIFDKQGGETAATALLRSNPPPAPAAGAPPPISARSAGAAALAGVAGGAAPSMPRPPEPPMSAPPITQPAAAQAYAPPMQPQVIPGPYPSVPPQSSGGRTVVMLVIGGLVVALVVAVVLLFLPGNGSLVVTVAGPGNKPVDAVQIYVDGKKFCDTSPCRVGELKPGTHMVKVSAAGYQKTADTAVAVEKGAEAVTNITLARASEGTGIRVSADGAGLRLSVDGKDIGPLPQELKDMSPGEHVIKIAGSDRYEPFEKHVTVEQDKMLAVEPKLKVTKGLARIEAGDGASGAKVLLVSGNERRPIPKLPIKIDIPTDKSYSLVATKKGYQDFKQELSFEDGQAEKTFTITMVETGKEPPPSTESHASTSSSSSSSSHHETSSGTEKPEAAAGTGTININSIPVSNVILDGRPLGTTPKVGISVKAGTHTVVFVHSELGRKARSANVPAGGSVTVAVRFP